MEEKCPYVREKMGASFLGSPKPMDFAGFSHAMGNWWENPCNSHIIQYTIECESNGKKVPILWEKYEYQFPRFSTYDGFCRIFREINFLDSSHLMGFPAISYALGNWRGDPCISHMMKYMTGWESNGKSHSFYGKGLGSNFPGIPHLMGFTMLWKIWWENPCISHMMKYTIGWEFNGKKAPILWEKYEYQFPRFSPYDGFCYIFPYCGKFMGQSIHFPCHDIG